MENWSPAPLNSTSSENNQASKYPIQEVMQMFGLTYAMHHHLNEQQAKALFCISSCKTGKLGYNVEYCPDCGHFSFRARSCNNRNCPCCQVPLEEKWVKQRETEIIPGIPYYHIVFTVPSQLYDLMEANPKKLYGLFCRAVSDTIIKLCNDKKWMGATPGVISVFQSWGDRLNYHVHLHTVVTGAGLTKCGNLVIAKHKGYLIPDKVLGAVLRGKFLAELKSLYEEQKLEFPGTLSKFQNSYNWQEYIDTLYNINWLPFAKETFNGNGNAVKYIARYAYHTAIRNSRIKSVEADGVTFIYKDYADGGKKKLITMAGEDFIGAFLRHILPAGFHRVRYAGFLANCVRAKKLALIFKLLNRVYHGNPYKNIKMRDLLILLYGKDISVCPCCGGTLNHIAYNYEGIPLLIKKATYNLINC